MEPPACPHRTRRTRSVHHPSAGRAVQAQPREGSRPVHVSTRSRPFRPALVSTRRRGLARGDRDSDGTGNPGKNGARRRGQLTEAGPVSCRAERKTTRPARRKRPTRLSRRISPGTWSSASGRWSGLCAAREHFRLLACRARRPAEPNDPDPDLPGCAHVEPPYPTGKFGRLPPPPPMIGHGPFFYMLSRGLPGGCGCAPCSPHWLATALGSEKKGRARLIASETLCSTHVLPCWLIDDKSLLPAVGPAE